MKKRITKRSVNAAKPAEKTYVVWDQDLTGFGLKVTPSSSKIYVLQYRAPGKGRSANATRITIGRHGDLTPDQARDVAAKMLLTVKQGGDPKKGRRPAYSNETGRSIHLKTGSASGA